MSRRHFLGIAGAGTVVLLGGYAGYALSPAKRSRLLLIPEDEFARVEQRISSDPTVRAWYADVELEANRLVEDETSPTEWQCGSAQGDCRNYRVAALEVENRLYTLALAHRVSGREGYADRAWTEMEAAAGLVNWNPREFLDVAHMTSGMALGYDWLYPALSEDQRATVRAAIREKGLEPALFAYRHGEWWTASRTSNWNLVCNGAMALGALAVRDSFPDLAQEVLDGAGPSIKRALERFGPDGGWLEGPGYWSYGIGFAVRCFSSLESVLGGDDGLSDSRGLDETGDFPIYTTGPTGLRFNFADAGSEEQEGTPEMFWLSRRYDRPVYTWFNRRWGADGVRSILYYQPDLDEQEPADVVLPLDRRFRGGAEVATMRSSWDDLNAIFAGLKAGSNKAPHNHLDLGTFALDALGRRWAEDLGLDNYALPGYADRSERRWSYYRTRAEGHNTLVINPGAGPDQDPAASARLMSFESRRDEAFAVADLSEAYATNAESVRRGLKLFERRSWVMVQDEISATAPAEVWWFMHTRAPSVEEQGQEAILTDEDGNRLWLRILSPSSGASFNVMSAEPLPTSPNPNPDQQRSREDYKKLTIELTDVTTERLTVLFVPLEPEQDPPQTLPEVTPLDEW